MIAAAVVGLVLGGVAAAPSPAQPAIRSPLASVDVIQAAVTDVVARTAPSVYAVTSFSEVPDESALWLGTMHGKAFAAFADRGTRNCGSAFAIDEAGTLLTNEHVVSGAASVWVTDDVGKIWPALVVGTDPRSDLAVLRIPTSTVMLSPAVDRDTAARGDLVLTLGNPSGLAAEGGASASVGVISAVHRSLPTLSARERRSYADLIQTTTPITSGSSGGPLLDLHGNVLGLVTAVAPAEGDRDAVGFAIDLSSLTVRAIIEQLADGAEVTHGYIGVTVADAYIVTDTAAPQVAGARIDAIERDAPADGVLRAGDVVLSFADQPIESGDMLSRLSATSPVDTDVAIRVNRAGKELDLTIRPRRRAQPADPVTGRTQTFAWAGARFRNAANGGVEVVAAEASPLKAGNVIRSINGQPIRNLADLLRVLHEQAGQPLKIELAQ